MSEPSSILGVTATGPRPDPTDIEVWPLDTPTDVVFVTEELAAVCPVTHQPDTYGATISYTGHFTLESKALKHYLWSFRDRPISAEGLAATIAADLSTVLGRGGLTLTACCAGDEPEEGTL
jgi:NADPH-dependent 7-cyano-7-deazaguanine reductase QueF